MNKYINIIDLVKLTLESKTVKDTESLLNLKKVYIYYLDKALMFLLKEVLDIEKPSIIFFESSIEVLIRINQGISLFSESLTMSNDELKAAGINRNEFDHAKCNHYETISKVKGKDVADDIMIKSLFTHLSRKFERYISSSFEAYINHNLDVAYTLLRMPYFDIQFYLDRLVCEPVELINDVLNKKPDEYDYISRYKNNKTKMDKIKSVIENSYKCIFGSDITDKLLEDMYSLKFDNESYFNMLNLIQKSNHIITTSKTGGSSKGEFNFTFLGDIDTVLPLANYYLSLGTNNLQFSVITIYYLFNKLIVDLDVEKDDLNLGILISMVSNLSKIFIESGATQEDITEMINELNE